MPMANHPSSKHDVLEHDYYTYPKGRCQLHFFEQLNKERLRSVLQQLQGPSRERTPAMRPLANSRTKRWNDILRIKSSVDICSLRISRNATILGCQWDTRVALLASSGFILCASFNASSLGGALPPIDLAAVCFVFTMLPKKAP